MSFEKTQTGLDYVPAKTALIVFQDNREQVLSGIWKPSLCGHNQSTVQISYEILTQSGNPLADEFAESVSKAYTKLGSPSSALFVKMDAKFDSILRIFRAGTQERMLFFLIRKWESRGTPLWATIRYELFYDLELTVYDRNGDSLASSRVQNVVTKEEGSATSMKKMQEMADSTFKLQIRALFDHPDIKKSLL